MTGNLYRVHRCNFGRDAPFESRVSTSAGVIGLRCESVRASRLGIETATTPVCSWALRNIGGVHARPQKECPIHEQEG
jgi:hypothetical protein